MKKLLLAAAACLFLAACALESEYGTYVDTLRIVGAAGTYAEPGEGFTLPDGRVVPASIVHDGVTYLPVPLLNNEPGLEILFDGDMGTITLMAGASAFTGEFISHTMRGTDEDGNNWTFANLNRNGIDYLLIEDAERGYARAYRLMGFGALEWYRNYVIFAAVTEGEKYTIRLVKLHYDDPQSGGEVLFEGETDPLTMGAVVAVIDGVLFFAAHTGGGWELFMDTRIYMAGEHTEEPVLLYTVYGERGLMLMPFINFQGVRRGELHFTVSSWDDWTGMQTMTHHAVSIGVE